MATDDYNKIISTVSSITSDYTYIPDPNNLICIDSSNNRLGINTINPEYSIHISGGSIKVDRIYFSDDIYFFLSNNKLSIFNGSNEGFIATNLNNILNNVGFTLTGTFLSDDRLKHNEANITNSLSIINKLNPQVYDMTTDFYDASYNGTISGEYYHRAGFIAQEIRQIEEISYCCIGDEYDSSGNPTSLAIDYNSIFTHGIHAIQELNNTIENQRTEIATLQTENINLNNEISVIKNALNTLLTANNLSTI